MCNTIGYNETLRNRRYFGGLEGAGMLCQSKGEYKASLLVVTETPSCIQISIKTTERCGDEALAFVNENEEQQVFRRIRSGEVEKFAGKRAPVR